VPPGSEIKDYSLAVRKRASVGSPWRGRRRDPLELALYAADLVRGRVESARILGRRPRGLIPGGADPAQVRPLKPSGKSCSPGATGMEPSSEADPYRPDQGAPLRRFSRRRSSAPPAFVEFNNSLHGPWTMYCNHQIPGHRREHLDSRRCAGTARSLRHPRHRRRLRRNQDLPPSLLRRLLRRPQVEPPRALTEWRTDQHTAHAHGTSGGSRIPRSRSRPRTLLGVKTHAIDTRRLPPLQPLAASSGAGHSRALPLQNVHATFTRCDEQVHPCPRRPRRLADCSTSGSTSA